MSQKNKNKTLKKTLSTVVKIGVSVFCLYLVFTKIPMTTVWARLEESNKSFLLLSILALFLSQWLSALRLNAYFHAVSFNLSSKSNLILYFIGMFYNFFIPGGIGGDAYKVYVLHKQFDWNAKKLTAALFVDRFSGLTAIGVLLVILAFAFSNTELLPVSLWLYRLLLGIVLMAVVIVSWLFTRQLFPSFKAVFTKGLLFSLGIQSLQLLSIALLVYNYEAQEHLFAYLFVFLVSVVLSIISFAGIGIREFVFYKASAWLHYEAGTSVAIGLLFTFATALISLVGVYFQFRKIPLEKDTL